MPQTKRRSRGGNRPGSGVIDRGLESYGLDRSVTCEVDDDASGTLTNTATIRSVIKDSNPANNNATVETAVVPATDLSVSVRADPDPVKVGGEVTYTATVTNNSYSDAAGVVVESYLQGAVTLAATSGCAEDSPTLTLTLVCTLGTVAEGDRYFPVRSHPPLGAPASSRPVPLPVKSAISPTLDPPIPSGEG